MYVFLIQAFLSLLFKGIFSVTLYTLNIINLIVHENLWKSYEYILMLWMLLKYLTNSKAYGIDNCVLQIVIN